MALWASLDGRVQLEHAHRTVAESIGARVKVPADARELVPKVEVSDFDGVRYKVDMPERDTLRVSVFVRDFDAIKEAVGWKYFESLYPGLCPTPDLGYSLTVKVDLKGVDDGSVDAGATPRRRRRTARRLHWAALGPSPLERILRHSRSPLVLLHLAVLR